MHLKEKMNLIFNKYSWLNDLAVSVVYESVDVFLVDKTFCIKLANRFGTYYDSTIVKIDTIEVQHFLITNDIKENDLKSLIYDLNQVLKMNTSRINFEYKKVS